MTWSDEWAAKAAGPSRDPIYLLASVDGTGSTPIRLSSHPWPGYTVGLLADQCSIRWGSVSPPAWDASASSATFAVDPTTSIVGVHRGTIVQLSIVLVGVTEPVYVGRLVDVRRPLRGVATIEVQGLEGSLWGSMQETSPDMRPFRRTQSTGVVSATYTAGDGSIAVTGTPLLDVSTQTNLAVLRITPTVGEPFYVGSTQSFAGGSLGGLQPLGIYDTVLADAAIGDAYQVVAYDEAHPVELTTRCLSSTRALWPDTWRMHLPPGCYDDAEADAQVAAHGVGLPNRAWKLRVQEPFDRFGDLLLPMLASAGCVLVQRHGQITARIIRAPVDYYSDVPIVADHTTIVDAESSAWAPYPAAFAVQVWDRSGRDPLPLIVSDAADTPFGALKAAMAYVGLPEPLPPIGYGGQVLLSTQSPTIPGGPRTYFHELRVPVYGGTPGPGTLSDRSAWKADLIERLRSYLLSSPEAATITINGWSHAAIGDALRVASDLMVSREASGVWNGQPCLIIGGGPDFFGSTSTYQVLAVSSNPTT